MSAIAVTLCLATPAAQANLRAAESSFRSGVASSVELVGRAPCTAHKAVRFYSRRVNEWRAKMGAPDKRLDSPRSAGCPRYLARVLQRKAYALRKAYVRFLEYHYHWQSWLPDKWARIGACETGYGRRPGSWTWDSGTYVSAFGIYRPGYAQFAHAIGQLSWDETRARLGRYPTPREQYNVALEIARRFGYGAWGCGGA